MLLTFCGDVHGKYDTYKNRTRDYNDVIQVGDMGVGFKRNDGTYYPNPPHEFMKERNHRFIRGNHDNPKVCRQHTQWIKDGHFENGILFVGGAYSIDREFRTQGFDWWKDEELSYSQLNKISLKYCSKKPLVMVTHCPPLNIARMMIDNVSESRTAVTFYSLFALYKPKLWVFGHIHLSFDRVIDGTRFICLNELEVKQIEI